MESSLAARLAAVGFDLSVIADPQQAFLALLEGAGEATLDDRLALEAHARRQRPDSLSAEGRRVAVEGFYAARWPGFEIVGTDRNDPIVITEYDDSWPARYETWRNLLAAALGPTAIRIEHVGSTAVVGLAAKPIIDIQVAVEDLEDEASYVPQIEALGIELRSRDVEHRYFRPEPGLPRDVHVHVCRRGGEWERTHLLFRDHLRAHAAVRDQYSELKRRLADRHRDDRLAYTEGKSAFIAEVMQTAEEGGAPLGR